MTGEGIVVSVGGGEAVVRISKASACSHDCSQCGGCSNPTYNMTVSNPVGAKLGDRVQIEASSAKVLLMAFLLYVLPVLFLMAAVMVADAVAKSAAVTFAAFAIVAVVWIFVIRKANRKIKLQNTIVRVISSDETAL